LQQLGCAGGRQWNLFRGLQDEAVSTSDGERIHPHRHHGGKIEWGNAGAHAERLADGLAVDALRNVIERLAHHQAGHTAGNLHHLDRTANRAARIVEGLAILGRENACDLVRVAVEERFVTVEDLDAIDHRDFAPLQERGVRGACRAIHILGGRIRNLRDHRAGGGVRDGIE
jgi:hypothetical protein